MGSQKSQSKSKNTKQVGKGGNSLFGRVGTQNNGRNVPQKKQNKKQTGISNTGKKEAAAGLTFVGGKLVVAGDSNKNKKQQNQQKRKKQNNISLNKRDGSANKKLVISLKDSAKCLKIRNLPVGTNPSHLQRVLQDLGSCKVVDLKVIDLPTGSAHAEVFASVSDLESLHKRLNQAEIDGRRILTEISSQPEL